MSDDGNVTLNQASTSGEAPGASPESASSTAETPAVAAASETATTGVVDTASAPIVPPAYVPNYKYKAALQEKELDPFYHGLIKDADSEKKVKELFSKVDAFDYIKQKKEAAETQFESLRGDFENVTGTVDRFNNAVKADDLGSAFRLAGITKEQVFKWAQKQIAIMEMSPEQRADFERHDQVNQQKYDLEQKVSGLQKQYETQAVQARTMQLEMSLVRPQVAQFADAWDRNSEPGAFRQLVIDEGKKLFYETQQDLPPEKVVDAVMKRFGKFLNMGDTMATPQTAVVQAAAQSQKPVIPAVTGNASSPIKKAPRTLEDLKVLAKSL